VTTINVNYAKKSVSPQGIEIASYGLRYPRWFHEEVMTHRVFGRSTSSSRAIPTERMCSSILEDIAVPLHIGKRQSGMQAFTTIPRREAKLVRTVWKGLAHQSVAAAKDLADTFDVAKQVANRLTEPYQHVNFFVTATDWENFFALRCHPAAEPHFRALAWLLADRWYGDTAEQVGYGEWHLPLITEEERASHDVEVLKRVSVARCARTSYKTHEGRVATVQEDYDLCTRLETTYEDPLEPGHLSPFEHQATPSEDATAYSGPFRGWTQYRKMLKRENMSFDYQAAVARGWRDDALAIFSL